MEDQEELLEKIFKIFDLAWHSNKEKVKEANTPFLKEVGRTINNLNIFQKVLGRIKDKKEESLLQLFFYFVAVEGGFVNHMDFICFLLVLQGHDIHDFWRRRYAHSLQEIANIDTYTKLQFLDEHQLTSFTKNYDRNLRNKIAHHEFEIDDEGKISIKGNEIDIEEINIKLIEFLNYTKKILTGSGMAQTKKTKEEKIDVLKQFLKFADT